MLDASFPARPCGLHACAPASGGFRRNTSRGQHSSLRVSRKVSVAAAAQHEGHRAAHRQAARRRHTSVASFPVYTCNTYPLQMNQKQSNMFTHTKPSHRVQGRPARRAGVTMPQEGQPPPRTVLPRVCVHSPWLMYKIHKYNTSSFCFKSSSSAGQRWPSGCQTLRGGLRVSHVLV